MLDFITMRIVSKPKVYVIMYKPHFLQTSLTLLLLIRIENYLGVFLKDELKIR